MLTQPRVPSENSTSISSLSTTSPVARLRAIGQSSVLNRRPSGWKAMYGVTSVIGSDPAGGARQISVAFAFTATMWPLGASAIATPTGSWFISASRRWRSDSAASKSFARSSAWP